MQRTMRRFMGTEVLPQNDAFEQIAVTGIYPLDVVEPLKKKAQAAGLWNLFLPGLREDEPGFRLAAVAPRFRQALVGLRQRAGRGRTVVGGNRPGSAAGAAGGLEDG
jgi:hypothetical protein